ncbi:hypothetical protein GCM10023200_30910 [Actinomycetospora chlora]|uniref:DUF1707 domain-containing protein n=1 Tax=Actinomycetospora chlora TaxID=663608 RepID=A0ABP9BBU3_9PSEU
MEEPVGPIGDARRVGGGAVNQPAHDDARDDRREPDLRVGDADRTAALDALGVHLGAGRLDVDEFGDRSERAAVAVRRSEIEALFHDLPAPHPPLPQRPARAVEETAVRARPVPGPPVHHGSGPAFAAITLLVLLVPLVVVAAGAGAPGGFLLFPLLFIVFANARHGRWHGRGPGGPGGPHGGPRDRW